VIRNSAPTTRKEIAIHNEGDLQVCARRARKPCDG
jgi:hypothetical protein